MIGALIIMGGMLAFATLVGILDLLARKQGQARPTSRTR